MKQGGWDLVKEAEKIIKDTEEKQTKIQEIELEEKKLQDIEEVNKQNELIKTITARMYKNTDDLEKRISAMQRKELK